MAERRIVAEREEAATGPTFLGGRGGTSAVMRSVDWARTPIGPVEALGAKHPRATGRPVRECRSEIWRILHVCWASDGAPRDRALMITGTESVPRVAPRERQGSGSRLIERDIAQDLDGEVRLDFKPQGVRSSIRLPIPERISTS
jgi:hypothetical protein